MTSTPPAVDYRPHVPPALTEMWRNNLRKSAVQGVQQQTRPRPFTLNYGFPGGGVAVVALTQDVIPLEIAQPCKVLSARMYGWAGKSPSLVTSAVITIDVTRFSSFGGSFPLHGLVPPTLTAAYRAELDVTDWTQNLLPGDLVVASLDSFVGVATLVSLHILLMPTQDAIGTSELVDNDGNVLVDNDGNVITVRG